MAAMNTMMGLGGTPAWDVRAIREIRPEVAKNPLAFGTPEKAANSARGAPGVQELSAEDQRVVQNLKQRDGEVRRHEQAHLAAAGPYAQGGPQYEYTRGPDNRLYATGGEVSIDVSPARTPEATLAKAQQVRRAALAAPDPSAQDRAVAAAASRLETEARAQLTAQRTEESRNAREATPRLAGVGPTGNPAPRNPYETFLGATGNRFNQTG